MPMRNNILKFLWNVCPPVNNKGFVVFPKCHKFQDKTKYISSTPVEIELLFLHLFSRNSQMFNNITFKYFILNFFRAERYMWAVGIKCIYATKWVVVFTGSILMKYTITQYNL